MKPLGMSTRVLHYEVIEGDIYKTAALMLTHPRAPKKLELTIKLPVFTENVITWRNTAKALLPVGTVKLESDMDIFLGNKPQEERLDLVIATPQEIARQNVEKAIADAIRPWFYEAETEVDETAVQALVDKWFASGEQWRVLKQSRVAQEDQHRGLIVDTFTNDSTHMGRMLSKLFNPKLHGQIDLLSTGVGDKINESYRLAENAEVVDGKIVPDKKGTPFCRATMKHSVGVGMNPRRAHLLRTTYEGAIDLTDPEEPLVTPYSENETNKLHGVNFRTAIMHLDVYTHEDTVVFSESAANRFVGARTVTQLIESHLPVTPLIKEGEPVSSTTPVALDGTNQVTASKLYYPGVVKEVISQRGARLGEETYRLWLRYESYYPLNTGDKVSNRHGGKGVVIVLPDNEMPHDSQGNPVDICIGPETITNRKAMSILWEMMVATKAEEDGNPIHVKMFNKEEETLDWNRDSIHDFEGLAKTYSDKTQLYLNGERLSEETFVAPLYWLRLDKISREIVSVVANNITKNNFGGHIDHAKKSGQRCNISKIMALYARGLGNVAQQIVADNMSAQEHFANIIESIRNYENTSTP